MPSVTKISEHHFKLNLTNEQLKTAENFINSHSGYSLIDTGDAGNTDYMGYLMQFQFACWSDFNSDGKMDLLLVFAAERYKYYLVIFHGKDDGSFEQFFMHRYDYSLDGILYDENQNKIIFGDFDNGTGFIHWDNKKNSYYIKEAIGD